MIIITIVGAIPQFIKCASLSKEFLNYGSYFVIDYIIALRSKTVMSSGVTEKLDGKLLNNKPQIIAPRVTSLAGVSTYALRGIRVRRVENLQGFGIDERGFIANYYDSNWISCFSMIPSGA